MTKTKKNNSAKIGKLFERKVKNKLKKAGYQIDYKPRTLWQNSDIFNLFDIMAYKPSEQKLLFIQAKKDKYKFTPYTLDLLKNFKVNKIETWIAYEGTLPPTKRKKIFFKKISDTNNESEIIL
jgi:Holliday junction resolvase